MTPRAIVLLERDGFDAVRWLLAGAIVLAAHAGLVATYFLFFSKQPQGLPEIPAVIVDLAPLPVTPASTMGVAPGPEMVESPPPAEPQVVEQTPEPIIEPTPPVETAIVALPEPPKTPPPPEVKKEEPKPLPPDPVKIERRAPAPRTTAAPRSERNTANTPAAPSAGSVERAAALASWRDQVLSQLQRAKRYPGGAESRREQGTATLSFTLGRNGNVMGRSIARSSGNPELDQEVLAMVTRAAPFPPFPAAMNQPSVHLTVPVRFSLR